MKDHVLFQGSFAQACLLLGNVSHVCNVANGLLYHIVSKLNFCIVGTKYIRIKRANFNFSNLNFFLYFFVSME